MKKLLLAIYCGAILLGGCKEHDVQLVFVRAADSSYVVSPVPAADPHNVLIEEFTGQACSNCPAAHSSLESIAAGNPGRINIIGMYLYNIPQAVPPSASTYDLRDSVATNISTAIYNGVSQLPGAGIDRVPESGSLQLSSGLWSNAVNSRLGAIDSLNLLVQSSYNAVNNEATITVYVTYTSPVSTSQNLSVVVVEDSMVSIQEYPAFDPTYPSGYDSFYVYTNVFRGMVSSPPAGDPILAAIATKPAGQVDRRIYTYTPKVVTPAINIAHCRVIAFVNSTNGTDLEVLQSAQCKLAP